MNWTPEKRLHASMRVKIHLRMVEVLERTLEHIKMRLRYHKMMAEWVSAMDDCRSRYSDIPQYMRTALTRSETLDLKFKITALQEHLIRSNDELSKPEYRQADIAIYYGGSRNYVSQTERLVRAYPSAMDEISWLNVGRKTARVNVHVLAGTADSFYVVPVVVPGSVRPEDGCWVSRKDITFIGKEPQLPPTPLSSYAADLELKTAIVHDFV